MIFLTGIYGSGKTELCKYLSNKLNIRYLRASDVIYHALNKCPPTNKRVADISFNQQILLSEIRSLDTHQRPNILEGHLCLINNEDKIECIPEYIFENLHLTGIILLKANIQNAQNRLWKRDHTHYPIEQLRQLQKQEQIHALRLSHTLTVPLITVHDGQREELKSLIVQLQKILDNSLDILSEE